MKERCAAPAPPPAKPTYDDALNGWTDAVLKFLECDRRNIDLVTFINAGDK